MDNETNDVVNPIDKKINKLTSEIKILELIKELSITKLTYVNGELKFLQEGDTFEEVDAPTSKFQKFTRFDQIPSGVIEKIIDKKKIDREYNLNQVLDLLKDRVLRKVVSRLSNKEYLAISLEYLSGTQTIKDIYDHYGINKIIKENSFKFIMSKINRVVKSQSGKVREFLDGVDNVNLDLPMEDLFNLC